MANYRDSLNSNLIHDQWNCRNPGHAWMYEDQVLHPSNLCKNSRYIRCILDAFERCFFYIWFPPINPTETYPMAVSLSLFWSLGVWFINPRPLHCWTYALYQSHYTQNWVKEQCCTLTKHIRNYYYFFNFKYFHYTFTSKS